jgi:hypothetical protein
MISVSYFLEVLHIEIQIPSLYITSLILLETKSEFRRPSFTPPHKPLRMKSSHYRNTYEE